MKSNVITPYPTHKNRTLSNEEKIALISENFREIMEVLDLDLTLDSLSDTPRRVAEMYVNEIFSGLESGNFPNMTLFDNPSTQSDQSNMVFVKTEFCSTCEHHFLPIPGTAYISYIPNKKLIGLSKIPRLVKYYAQRPQLQERLTAQVADKLAEVLETEHIAVSITAQHFCMIARGVEDTKSHTVTNALRGDFRRDELLRREFFEAIQRGK